MRRFHRDPSPLPFAAAVAYALLAAAGGCVKEEETVFHGGGSGGGSGDDPPAAGLDDDGDGLEDRLEFLGWDIVVDEHGYGAEFFSESLSFRHVTSEFTTADTDGDGLTDLEEYELQSDPSRADTDGDSLADTDEVNRWITNPNSVDSDNDARGRDGDGSPDVFMFDGNELALVGTSPSLDDTDGDGFTDEEEIDDPIRDPRIAELPRLEIEVVGDVDVRLNVEYAETIGQSVEYGTTLSVASSTSQEQGSADSFEKTLEISYSHAIEAKIGLPPEAKVTKTGTFSGGVSVGQEWSSSVSSSQENQQESSRSRSDSREMTEVAASGRISTGVRVRNSGDTAYTLENLAISVLYQTPGDAGGQVDTKTMATLLPAIESVTLSPGETSPVLQVSTEEVNSDVIKQFLARPDTLVFEPAVFDLRNADGIDFDFLNQNTFPRTAVVQIDSGNGVVKSYRVATNVARTDGGGYAGITVREVLRDLLGLTEGSPDGFELVEQVDELGAPTGRLAIRSLLGKSYEDNPGDPHKPRGFWSLIASELVDLSPADLTEVALHGGDSISLIYQRDDDADGLFSTQESYFGTDDTVADSDGDGTTDFDEVVVGWTSGDAGIADLGYPRQVFSDPRVVDSDQDGLADTDERSIGSDPTAPDTDDDSLIDGIDPFPLVKAAIVYVDASVASGGNGTSWAQAFDDLQDAIAAAISANTNNQNDPDAALDDISQLWVAAGTYLPTQGSSVTAAFSVMNRVRILGGFQGGETKAGQRNADPLTNGCALSGDLLADDPTVLTRASSVADAARQDNSANVVVANLDAVTGLAIDATAQLDGFMIVGGNARAPHTIGGGGIRLVGTAAPTLKNLLLYQNSSFDIGGGIQADAGTKLSLEGCVLLSNYALTGGGIHAGLCDATDTIFEDNEAIRGGAAALRPISTGRSTIRRCEITFNRAAGDATLGYPLDQAYGGGFFISSHSIDFQLCRFRGNSALGEVINPNSVAEGGGAAVFLDLPSGSVKSQFINCEIWNNTSGGGCGGAVTATDHPSGSQELRFVNATIAGNASIVGHIVDYDPSGNPKYDSTGYVVAVGGVGVEASVTTTFENCILSGNSRTIRPFNLATNQFEPPYSLVDEAAQLFWIGAFGASGPVGATSDDGLVWHWSGLSNIVPRRSLIEALSEWAGTGNLGGDPLFGSLATGNLRLGGGSPCIDAGSNFVDADLFTAGLQPLPLTDLDGEIRELDGDGDGSTTVDMGAYERQP